MENNNFHYAIKSLNSDFKSDYFYKEFSTLHEGLIKARRYSEDAGEHKLDFIDEKETEVIDFMNTAEPSDFSDHKAVVQNTKGLYGYIDTSNTVVIEPQFIDAFNFVNGKALVRIYNVKLEGNKPNHGYRLINTKGEIIFDFGAY